MNLCIIAPVAHLELTRRSYFNFVLAQLVLENERYADFYKWDQGFKIMDNGAYELRKPLSTEEIMEAAERARVDEIVVPDIPKDPEASVELAIDFFASLSKKELEKYRFQVVPHGKSIHDWMDNFYTLRDEDGIRMDTVGLSILDLHKWNHRARPIVAHMILPLKDVEVHLLGLDEVCELFCYKGLRVRSVDTSLPISLAKRGIFLDEVTEETPHERVEMDEVLDETALGIAEYNIEVLKEICLTV